MEIDKFHPLITRWFRDKYDDALSVQDRAWRSISGGEHTLISAPTGSGKTLAAFLWSINDIVLRKAAPNAPAPSPSEASAPSEAGMPARQTAGRLLYVSPLKALNNDIHRNLITPLAEIRALGDLPPVSVGIRSGDSTDRERAKILRHPPDIFITTPEAINIMLTSEGGRQNLSSIATVIVDEIHILAGSKRGTLFMTNLERLQELCSPHTGRDLHRIAMSATVRPLEKVAAFLGGFDDSAVPRPVTIIEGGNKKEYEIKIALGPPDHSSWWERQIPLMAAEIMQHNCTLIFCNSRRAAEKASHLLNEHFGEKIVFAHHGSLSREYRYWVEQELKEGRMKAVSATSSLELGIDIGSIDRVMILQPPFSLSSAVQRIGRSNHQVNRASSAAFIPLHPRDILRAIVQSETVLSGDIEAINIPENCLDILSQIILSETAGRSISLPRLKRWLYRSWSFHRLPAADLDRVLEMLAGRYKASRVRELQPRIVIIRGVEDDAGGAGLGRGASAGAGAELVLEGRKGNRFLIYQSGGVIPDRGYFDIRISGSEEKIGELDEEFVFERNLHDRFTLGNRVWQIDQIDNQKVLVSPSRKSSMIVPFWKADTLGADSYYSEKVNRLLETLNKHLRPGGLADDAPPPSPPLPHSDAESTRELFLWLNAQRMKTATDLPHRHHIVVEELNDPGITPDTIHFIVHTNWGASANAALTFCLQAKFKQQETLTLQGLYTDEAAILSLPLEYSGFDILQGLSSYELPVLLGAHLAGTGLFGSRFRMNAARALLVLRKGFNLRTPLWLQRMKSLQLLEKVLFFKDFPIVQETWRELLEQDLAVRQLQQYLTEIEEGQIYISKIQTRTPSPFAADILWQLNNTYLYRDDSLESAQGVAPAKDMLRRFIHETDQLPEIPAALQTEYLLKRRRLMKEYQPETEEDLRFYLQDRRIFTAEERAELIQTIGDALPVQALMDEVCFSPATAGSRLWFNRDIDPQQLADAESRKSLALEWFDWQAMVSLERARAIWGEMLGVLIDDGLLLQWQDSCLEQATLERLLRMRRQWTRREVSQVSVGQLQYQSAVLNNIRMYEQGSVPLVDGSPSLDDAVAHVDLTLEKLIGTAFPAALFTTGIFPARFGRAGGDALEGAFHRSAMVWTGLGNGRVVICPDQELATYLRWGREDASPNAAAGNAARHDVFPPDRGRYSFQQIHAIGKGTVEELQKALYDLVSRGRIFSDSYRAMQLIEDGNFHNTESRGGRRRSTGSASAASASAAGARAGAVRLGRRHRHDWHNRYNTPGLWARVAEPAESEPAEAKDPEEILEELRIHIYQLFERHPLLNKDITNDEHAAPRWRSLLPVLRQMELAGELIGGKICSELPGLQFCLADAEPPAPAPATASAPPPATAWFWVNSHDPAYVLRPEHAKRGRHNYVLFFVAAEKARCLALVKNKGRDIELFADENLLPGILHGFFRMVLLENTKGSARLLTIDEQPVREHHLFEPLKEQGFFEDQRGLILWKH